MPWSSRIQGIAPRSAGRDAWIAVFLAAACGVAIGWVTGALSDRFRNHHVATA